MQFSFLFSIFARRNDTKLNDMRKILLLAAVALMTVVSVQAQRRSCLHSSSVTRASEEEAMPLIMDFDPQKTFRINSTDLWLTAFILVTFSVPLLFV